MSKELFDVRMPDGTMIRGVPKGTTQSEVMRRYNKMKESAPHESHGASGSFETPDIAQRFQKEHPYLAAPAVGLARIGQGAVDAASNIAGLPGAVYHAVTDPLTEKEQADPTYSDFGSTLTNPIRRLFLEPQFEQLNKAKVATSRPEALARLAAGGVPGLGPTVANVAERATTDPLGAAGEAMGYAVIPELGREATDAGLSKVGDLRTKARNVAQDLTRSSARKTTEPIVEKYNTRLKKAERAQSAADAVFDKTQNANQQLDVARTAAERDAAEKTATNQKKTAQQLELNRETQQANARSESITRSLKEGSQRLGEQVKDLDGKIRQEANEKYSTVRQAVANDPGVPLSDLAEAARHAEQSILKGSAENIKQFRELARKAPEQETLHTNVGDVSPGDPLYELLKSQGAIDTGGNLPFDQLQGYSSEIGAKLAKGGLQGDVYQALKYLKDKIDTAKTTIADRNGAGAALRNADNFWRSYMDLFYDSDSALAKVRESVGTLDPQFYADPFTKGKAAEVAIGKLKSMKSQHAGDLSSVADLARNLRSANEELQGLRTGTVKPVEPPKRVAPKEVQAGEPKARRVVSKPDAPTSEDILNAKRGAVRSKGESFMELQRRDLYAVAAPLIAGVLGGNVVSGLLGGVGLEAAIKGIGKAMTRPQIVEWIAKPTAADLAAIEKLPEPIRAQLTTQLKSIMNQERASGRPLKVSPGVSRLVGVTAGGIPQNRQEAMDRLDELQ